MTKRDKLAEMMGLIVAQDASGGSRTATRRDVIRGSLGGAAAVLLAGCLDPGAEDAAALEGLDGLDAELEANAGTCSLYPQQMEGPFYLDLNMVRRNITDGKAGTALQFSIQVLSLSACAPIRNAPVDIWYADASGWYSGYPRQGDRGNVDTRGQRFLRGTQLTDADGKVTFDGIYPGWYRGRTTHVHVKVHPTATTQVTSQMYFPEAITSAVYRTSPYSVRGQKDTSNARDRIANTGGSLPPLLAVTPSGAGYVASLVITVRG
jgi:protocatechuate 3,4-dioxygenase beta subunit